MENKINTFVQADTELKEDLSYLSDISREDKLEKIQKSLQNVELIQIKGDKGDPGEKGDTPSAEEIRQVVIPLIPAPIKGDQGDPGKKGDKGKDAPSKKEIKKIVDKFVKKAVKAIPKPKDGKSFTQLSKKDKKSIIKELQHTLEAPELDTGRLKSLIRQYVPFQGRMGLKAISQALDVNVDNIQNGDVLVWDAQKSQFIPGQASSTIDETNLVHKTGDETIDGKKTFLKDLIANGKVGIGINPVSKLHIYQNSNDVGAGAGLTIEQAGTGDPVIQFLIPGARRWVIGVDNNDGDSFKISPTLNVGSNPALTINTSGQITIGNETFTAYPYLHLENAKNVIVGEQTFADNQHASTLTIVDVSPRSTTAGAGITFAGNYSDTKGGKIGGFARVRAVHEPILGQYGGEFVIDTASGNGKLEERFRVGNTGNVGIGVTNPQSRLHIVGDGNNGGIRLEGGDGGTAVPIAIHTDKDRNWNFHNINSDITNNALSIQGKWSGADANILLNPTSTGKVGIGTTSPDYRLDVAGNMRVSGLPTGTLPTTDTAGAYLVFTDSSGVLKRVGIWNDGNIIRQTT